MTTQEQTKECIERGVLALAAATDIAQRMVADGVVSRDDAYEAMRAGNPIDGALFATGNIPPFSAAVGAEVFRQCVEGKQPIEIPSMPAVTATIPLLGKAKLKGRSIGIVTK